jgi:glycosyltransferase involved in cell wall biosynthesis
MTRLLFVSRYRTASMHRKVELLAEQHGFAVLQVAPREWRDEFGVLRNEPWTSADGASRRVLFDMRGRINDPHRATYKALDFGMRTFAPDVIYAEEEPDSLAALQLAAARALFAPRAKLALYTWQNVQRPMSRSVRAVMYLTLRAADAVLCANTAAITLLRNNGFERPAPLIPAIGVDMRHFYAAPRATEPRGLRVVYAGRLDISKGLDTVVEAVASMRSKPARVSFIGDGPDRAALQARVNAAGIGHLAVFLGALPQERLASELRQHDALVLASRSTATWQEQFGRVLIEAMASGAIPVGSDSGAIPEVIGDAGLTFAAGDAAALASALARLQEDAVLSEHLRGCGLARVAKHYTQERVATQTAAFVQSLLA